MIIYVFIYFIYLIIFFIADGAEYVVPTGREPRISCRHY